MNAIAIKSANVSALIEDMQAWSDSECTAAREAFGHLCYAVGYLAGAVAGAIAALYHLHQQRNAAPVVIVGFIAAAAETVEEPTLEEYAELQNLFRFADEIMDKPLYLSDEEIDSLMTADKPAEAVEAVEPTVDVDAVEVPEVDLSSLKVAELRKMAKGLAKGINKMTKAQLIELLEIA